MFLITLLNLLLERVFLCSDVFLWSKRWYLLVNDVLDTLAISLLLLLVLLHVGLGDEFALLGQCGYHGVLVNDVGIVLVLVLPLRSGLLLTRLLLWALCIENRILS